MQISIGCDHGGYALKETVKAMLLEQGYEVMDVGCHSTESVDYPLFGGYRHITCSHTHIPHPHDVSPTHP